MKSMVLHCSYHCEVSEARYIHWPQPAVSANQLSSSTWAMEISRFDNNSSQLCMNTLSKIFVNTVFLTTAMHMYYDEIFSVHSHCTATAAARV